MADNRNDEPNGQPKESAGDSGGGEGKEDRRRQEKPEKQGQQEQQERQEQRQMQNEQGRQDKPDHPKQQDEPNRLTGQDSQRRQNNENGQSGQSPDNQAGQDGNRPDRQGNRQSRQSQQSQQSHANQDSKNSRDGNRNEGSKDHPNHRNEQANHNGQERQNKQEQLDESSRRVRQTLDDQRKLLALPLVANLRENVKIVKQLFSDSSDLIFHEFSVRDGADAVLIYIDGISDKKEADMHILSPLQHLGTGGESGWEAVLAQVSISCNQMIRTVQEAVDHITFGDMVLMLNGERTAAAFNLQQWQTRSIEEPEAETVVRGPREGFVETLRTNTSMLRRRLQSPALKLKPVSIGRYSKTSCCIAYLEGVTAPELVAEMEQRLRRIDIDGVFDSNLIEEMIEDNRWSPFPQLQSTERPDVVVANLLEGRIALLINGTPFSLIAPASFFTQLQSPEDYYQRWFVSTPIRWIRMLFCIIAVFTPSIYIAVLSFHQEMIPTSLLLTIAKSREQIPFPALVEALLMEITFEALREAGVRLPKQVGAAVSIVGALVIGQAAISAGIVSSPMIMVVAITGVASFLIPNYSLGISLRLLRFPIMFSAGVLGLYGIVLATLLIVIHLMTLRSFGQPYLSPISPAQPADISDTLLRMPRWGMRQRPHFTGSFWNRYRMAPSTPGRKKHDSS